MELAMLLLLLLLLQVLGIERRARRTAGEASNAAWAQQLLLACNTFFFPFLSATNRLMGHSGVHF